VHLFIGLWPSPEAVAALATDLLPAGEPPAGEPPGWRLVPVEYWHVSLAFHGCADPGVLARRLEHRVSGAVAPRLRIAGAGASPGVRWAGVEADSGEDRERLEGLVTLAGADPATFVPHVSVLRRRQRPGRGAEPDPRPVRDGHCGPWWCPGEVLLVASERVRGVPRYRPVHRVRLAAG
jgi:RNA 2',3'-cyclic 3'-phosphodiesterase